MQLQKVAIPRSPPPLKDVVRELVLERVLVIAVPAGRCVASAVTGGASWSSSSELSYFAADGGHQPSTSDRRNLSLPETPSRGASGSKTRLSDSDVEGQQRVAETG
ncbi:unnamed protein product, partial [Amoebophrya sp. A120]|eukprot:GSA120T00022685001.1